MREIVPWSLGIEAGIPRGAYSAPSQKVIRFGTTVLLVRYKPASPLMNTPDLSDKYPDKNFLLIFSASK